MPTVPMRMLRRGIGEELSGTPVTFSPSGEGRSHIPGCGDTMKSHGASQGRGKARSRTRALEAVQSAPTATPSARWVQPRRAGATPGCVHPHTVTHIKQNRAAMRNLSRVDPWVNAGSLRRMMLFSTSSRPLASAQNRARRDPVAPRHTQTESRRPLRRCRDSSVGSAGPPAAHRRSPTSQLDRSP